MNVPDLKNQQHSSPTDATAPPLELWGGPECTVNRIRDNWHDQTPRSGHDRRKEDLALFASLGIKSLRYPALWESMAPDTPDQRNFTWTDERLDEMRRLGINPILTLCHHGSGPRYTSLVEDSFAPGLAEHAAAVARRYPWVQDWTPVNEPLTTARFSALYGFWYPHTRDERLFWIALLNEIDATRLSMKAIRAVNPQARLIQTDDLGYCHATEPLQCAADFQNDRRWLGWDLLCGRVVPGHALWDRLASYGLADRLRRIADDPCPPDIIGINHYLSSERLLDHRLELHAHRSLADQSIGDCEGVPHVDVDAIRNWRPGVQGVANLVRQAWERYGIPLAITECHNGATREYQVRWFVEVWNRAKALRSEGVDLRAVTAWALLGSYDWNRMVTRFPGHYEPGVFDMRWGEPRPTLMARVLRELADGREPELAILDVEGWWRRETRFLQADDPQPTQFELVPGDQVLVESRPLLIVGDDGALTHLAVRACEARGLHYTHSGSELSADIQAIRPWAVLDARDREGLAGPRRRSHDAHGARSSVARTCADLGVPCALFSSAFGPGLAAEGLSLPGVLVARTGPVYTPWERHTAAVRLLDALDAGQPVQPSACQPWHGVYGPDLMDCVLDLLLDGASGALDLAPREPWSEAQFARALAEVAGHDPAAIELPENAPQDLGHPPAWRQSAWLPIAETTLERFVRESRIARRLGEKAVHRREDEARLEEAG